MMQSPLPLFLLALSSVLSASSPPYDGYTQMAVPPKRAALVLDRLLIALQKALHEDAARGYRDPPRTSPLRIPTVDDADMMGLAGEELVAPAERALEYEPRTAPLRIAALGDDTSALQRRGQGGSRGRVLRCYFNAVTCF